MFALGALNGATQIAAGLLLRKPQRGGFLRPAEVADRSRLESHRRRTIERQPRRKTRPLHGLLNDGRVTVSFRFQPIGLGAKWQIDDLYVDPLKMG